MARRLITLLGFSSALALAQVADPTRPAIDSGAAATTADLSGQAATPGLQSIIQRRHGKPAALINGSIVGLGDKVGDARVVKIGEDFVMLRGPLGRETLRLTPGVEKRTARKDKQ